MAKAVLAFIWQLNLAIQQLSHILSRKGLTYFLFDEFFDNFFDDFFSNFSCHINDTDGNGMTAVMWSCFRATQGLDPTRLLLTLGTVQVFYEGQNTLTKYLG